MKKRFLLALVPLLFDGCNADKYPYPPQFTSPEQVPPTVLTAPPAQGSADYHAALDQILRVQAVLKESEIAAIKQEITIRPELMVQPVLGEQYTPEHYPALYTL